MRESEIVTFLKANIAPLRGMGRGGGVYRCSATLIDGLFLPCVAFRSRHEILELAIRRFAETIRDREQYRHAVEVFACAGNRINFYQIHNLHPSRFAIPEERLLEVGGETSMSWTQFTATMKDGKQFQFGTTYHDEFFDMPDSYSGVDIAVITPAQRFARPQSDVPIYREKPFFECAIDGL